MLSSTSLDNLKVIKLNLADYKDISKSLGKICCTSFYSESVKIIKWYNKLHSQCLLKSRIDQMNICLTFLILYDLVFGNFKVVALYT